MGKHGKKMRKHEKKRDFEKIWGILREKIIRKPNRTRSRCPQICFHFQIKKDMFISVFVFFSEILFRMCLFRLFPFQEVSFQTVSFSSLVLLYYILFKTCLCWLIHPPQKCKPDMNLRDNWHKKKNIWDILT